MIFKFVVNSLWWISVSMASSSSIVSSFHSKYTSNFFLFKARWMSVCLACFINRIHCNEEEKKRVQREWISRDMQLEHRPIALKCFHLEKINAQMMWLRFMVYFGMYIYFWTHAQMRISYVFAKEKYVAHFIIFA